MLIETIWGNKIERECNTDHRSWTSNFTAGEDGKFRFVYCTRNLINNKIYVGQHTTTNLSDGYIGSGVLFQKAVKKYGKENFKTRHCCYCNNQRELNQAEIYWIAYWESIEKGYNLKQGGKSASGYKYSQEICNKISKSLQGHSVSEESLNKMRNTKIERGICKSKEERIKERLIEEENIKKRIIEKCYKYNQIEPETLKVVREFNLLEIKEIYSTLEVDYIREICRSVKQNNKLSLFLNYFWVFQGQDMANLLKPYEDSKRRRKVDQFDLEDNFIKTWSSIFEAESFYNSNPGNNIVNTCRGEQKTAYKYKWKYHERY